MRHFKEFKELGNVSDEENQSALLIALLSFFVLNVFHPERGDIGAKGD